MRCIKAGHAVSWILKGAVKYRPHRRNKGVEKIDTLALYHLLCYNERISVQGTVNAPFTVENDVNAFLSSKTVKADILDLYVFTPVRNLSQSVFIYHIIFRVDE